MNGKIKLEEDGETVLIMDVQVQDETLYQFLKEINEDKRIDRLVNVIRIGVIGLKRMAVGEELDYVEKEFNSLKAKFEKMFDPEVKTSYFGKLSSLLEEYFDEGGTIENLFDLKVDGSPLYKLRKELQEEFEKLRDIIKEKEEIIEVTTLKGYKFEDACEKILSEFVSKDIGDELERKTNEIGKITGSFAGDFLITLRDLPDKKIVLETKDWGTITQPQIIENLKGAMENRDAKYGIFVSRSKEALPRKIGWFNEFRGNMLVCALGSKEEDTFSPELLNIAYQWAKMRVKKEIKIEERAFGELSEGIKEIERRIEIFSQIKRQCTNINNATEEIKVISDDLRRDIKEQISKIQKAIAVLSEEKSE